MKRVVSGIAGPMMLVAGIVAYTISFRLPPGRLSPGLDPSIWLAANTFADHGLEMGRDIVHVFGPLGCLVYPIAGKGHLRQAHVLTASLHALFLAGLAVHAVLKRRYATTTAILLVCAFFLFQNPHLREAKVYSICLVFWMLDLAHPGRGVGLVPALISAVFVFAKFNMALTLVPMMVAQIGIAWITRGERWWCLAKAGAFILPAAVIGSRSFSSLDSAWLWVRRSMDIAAGNSEAMSLVCPNSQLVLGIVVLGIVITLGLISSRGSRLEGLVWLSLVSVPVFLEFKHGFVRAGDHVYAFFSFLPVVAATRLLGTSSPLITALVAASVVLNAMGPGITHEAFSVGSWVTRARWEGVRVLMKGEAYETQQVRQNTARLRDVALRESEARAIGDATVELIPNDITPLHGTSLQWRPSPFFQHILVRSPDADSVNARHLAGPRAAQCVLLNWVADDGVHPMDRCPLTYLALLNSYHVMAQEGDRLLLGRGPAMRVTLKHLASASSRWGSNVALPDSSHLVVASVKVRRTIMGGLLKVLFRTPPVYVRFEDGTRRRFIPATAAHGLMVSREPQSALHFRHFLESKTPHPACPPHATMRLKALSRIKHFSDEVHIDFYAMVAEPAS